MLQLFLTLWGRVCAGAPGSRSLLLKLQFHVVELFLRCGTDGDIDISGTFTLLPFLWWHLSGGNKCCACQKAIITVNSDSLTTYHSKTCFQSNNHNKINALHCRPAQSRSTILIQKRICLGYMTLITMLMRKTKFTKILTSKNLKGCHFEGEGSQRQTILSAASWSLDLFPHRNLLSKCCFSCFLQLKVNPCKLIFSWGYLWIISQNSPETH